MSIEITGPERYEFQYHVTLELVLRFWGHDVRAMVDSGGEDSTLNVELDGNRVELEVQVKGAEHHTKAIDEAVLREYLAHFPSRLSTNSLLERLLKQPSKLVLLVCAQRAKDFASPLTVRPNWRGKTHGHPPLSAHAARSFLAQVIASKPVKDSDLEYKRAAAFGALGQATSATELNEAFKRLILQDNVTKESVIARLLDHLRVLGVPHDRAKGALLQMLQRVRDSKGSGKDVVPALKGILNAEVAPSFQRELVRKMISYLNPYEQWRRLRDTCRWSDSIVAVDEIYTRPRDAIRATPAAGFLIVAALLAQMAMFCALGINVLSRYWVVGEYLGTAKVVDVFLYQLRHIVAGAMHLRLTEEGAVFLASVVTETLVVACYVVFCSLRVRSVQTGRARRQFATYMAAAALFKLNVVSWLVACCAFISSLLVPTSWLRDFALTLGFLGACIVSTGVWIFAANRRRMHRASSDAKDCQVPVAYSPVVALGAVFAVLLWTNRFSEAFEPQLAVHLNDACYSTPAICTVDILPKNLPSPIVLDKLHFNLSVRFVDAHGALIGDTPHGASASFRLQRSSTNTLPLYVKEDGRSHGFVVASSFNCPTTWQGPGSPKLLIPNNPVYTTARLADAPSLDYPINVRVAFDNNFASLFRGADSGCSFWP